MTRIFKPVVGITCLLIILSGGYRIQAQDIQAASKLTRAERFEDASSAFKALLQKDQHNGDIYYYYRRQFPAGILF